VPSSQKILTPFVDISTCNGCGACAEIFPAYFELRDDRGWVTGCASDPALTIEHFVNVCPRRAISVLETEFCPHP